MSYIDYLRIVDHLDIHKGDRIYVSSDIKKLVFSCHQNDERFDGNLFIDSILHKIGSDGTLLFPTYNWGFCEGLGFHYHQTKSEAGTLSNIALKRSDFKRTQHPIYSFAVWGKDQSLLCGLNNISSFGADSAFGIFYQHHFKHLFIDALTATFLHYCEEKIEVPYRFHKQFSGSYTDEYGLTEQRTYSMYVRHLDMKVTTMIMAIHKMFSQHEASNSCVMNGVSYTVLDMPAAYDLIERDIIYNKSKTLVVYEGQ